MKKSQLKEMISKLVSEELKSQLPQVLSEMYVRKIVSENVKVSKPRSLSELDYEDEIDSDSEYDERIPEPLENSDDSIYKKNPFSNNNEVTHKLLSSDNPLHEIYQNMEFSKSNEGVDISHINEGNETNSFGKFFDKMMGVTATQAPILQTNNAEENRLDEYRKSLEK